MCREPESDQRHSKLISVPRINLKYERQVRRTLPTHEIYRQTEIAAHNYSLKWRHEQSYACSWSAHPPIGRVSSCATTSLQAQQKREYGTHFQPYCTILRVTWNVRTRSCRVACRVSNSGRSHDSARAHKGSPDSTPWTMMHSFDHNFLYRTRIWVIQKATES